MAIEDAELSTAYVLHNRGGPYESWRWQADLPEATNEGSLDGGFKLLESYSGIAREDMAKHVKKIRDNAFAVHHYPYIGRWRFLHLWIVHHPEYENILRRLKSGETLLDTGCLFGQALRKLVQDGAPSENLTGVDIHPESIDLGYELFCDRDRFRGRFVAEDLLSSPPSPLDRLDGSFDIILASSYIHLYGWDDQVRICERLVRFFRPDAEDTMIVGRQLAKKNPLGLAAWRERQARAGVDMDRSYHHNVESFQALWDEVGRRTGSRWAVSGEIVNEVSSEDLPRWVMRFVVRRAS